MPHRRVSSMASASSEDISEFDIRRYTVLAPATNQADDTASNEDEEMAEDNTSDSPEQEFDHGAESAWQAPDAENVMATEEGAARLRRFQELPGEAQIRVLYLHQVEAVPIPQAIDEVVTEQRLRLAESPIQAREAHTVALRLTLQQINNNLFNQWLRLNVLIQALPPVQQETGRRVLRLASNDPRSFKAIYQATREAASLNNEFINRTLRGMSDNASSFFRNNEDLRGLHRYDRHQAPPDSDPVAGPPDGLPTADNIMDFEDDLHRSSKKMKSALDEYYKILNEWVAAAFLHLPWCSGDEGILDLMQWYNTDRLTNENEEVAAQILDSDLLSAAWEDPETCELPAMLLGPFFMCALGVHEDRPSYALLNNIAGWEKWRIGSPGAHGLQAAQQLYDMDEEISVYLNELKVVLANDIKDLLPNRREREHRERLLNTLDKGTSGQSFDRIRRAMDTDIRNWPDRVRIRTFTVAKLWTAKDKLVVLRRITLHTGEAVSNLGEFMPEPAEEMRPAFDLYMRAMRRNCLVKGLSDFSAYHFAAVRDLRRLVDQSCRHPRARALMLSALPPSGYGANLERARDVAVAANVEPSITDSAVMLLAQQQHMGGVAARIRFHEKTHLDHLFKLLMHKIETILHTTATGRDQASDRATLSNIVPPSHHPLALEGTPAFGPVLRTLWTATTASSDADATAFFTAIPLLTTAATQQPLEDVLSLIAAHSAGGTGTSHESSDVRLLAQLALRHLYLSTLDAPATRLDASRALSRHCWFAGLHGAWMEWGVDAGGVVGDALACLCVESTGGVLMRAALEEDDKDYNKVERLLAGREHGLPESMETKLFKLIDRLNLLRDATIVYLKRSDRVDPDVLPAEFVVKEMDLACDRFSREAVAMEALHEIVSFDKSVLDGGRATVGKGDWKIRHNERMLRSIIKAIFDTLIENYQLRMEDVSALIDYHGWTYLSYLSCPHIQNTDLHQSLNVMNRQ
ncbi:hypothetical protein UCDDS831_g04223 [Diplodia seriata]|uniref:Uncharacterized protein n=1 Tax=Diplodia seriata TaxID=420778 RepID=A0A0G2EEU7_9PEZI|nr:hypothetical protein UCDDS831_g04223 [Diplodia seriata]